MLEGLSRKVSEMHETSSMRGISLGRIAREIAEKNLKIMEIKEGMKISHKALTYLINWKKGGIKELFYTFLMKVHKLSLIFKSGFFLKSFAIYYTKNKLFEVYGFSKRYKS